ncbi:MAG: exodeoxyribonuclease V subunit alpha [Proteobacteria bacterium]|jgi:exodeoxyribonuclease V alpha subunit|nr:exodeoxyribonuclease V subunit alpha [Pseudomonadota bacterium]
MDTDARLIDVYFRDFIHRLVPDCSEALLNLAAEVSRALARQHSCLDLTGRPDAAMLMEELSRVGLNGPGTPLTLHGNKLYLSRYFVYERDITSRLVELNQALPIVDEDRLGRELVATFSTGSTGTDPDWQQVAALQVLTRKLTIITGGPGTGKTSTVAQIIGIADRLTAEPLEIRLAAPTGKAAMRLGQSLSGLMSEARGGRLRVQTLHRLLGVRRDGRGFRFNSSNPIPADLIIVDEASMIDLPMMDRLIAALPDDCRLVLVGDPGQLPSVETGNVLADLCAPGSGYSRDFARLARNIIEVRLPVARFAHPMHDVVCRLTRSHRFSADEGIGRLAAHIAQRTTSLPATDAQVRVESPQRLAATDGAELLVAELRPYLELLEARERDPGKLVRAFEATRILAPMREGDLGVLSINDTIEALLTERGLRQATQAFYHGRPILIQRNDYNLQLYNGDVGICIMDDDLTHPMVAFPNADGQIRLLLASRLPSHETCFAMTVHKSQGSEFQTVTLVLPLQIPAAADELLTRELVYTAVTRARARVILYSTADTWQQCMVNGEPRVSGIRDFFATEAPVVDDAPPSDIRQLDLFP